jgi:hypothetical protein
MDTLVAVAVLATLAVANIALLVFLSNLSSAILASLANIEGIVHYLVWHLVQVRESPHWNPEDNPYAPRWHDN